MTWIWRPSDPDTSCTDASGEPDAPASPTGPSDNGTATSTSRGVRAQTRSVFPDATSNSCLRVVPPAHRDQQPLRFRRRQEADAHRRGEVPPLRRPSIFARLLGEPGVLGHLRLEIVVLVGVRTPLRGQTGRNQEAGEIPVRRPHPTRQPFRGRARDRPAGRRGRAARRRRCGREPRANRREGSPRRPGPRANRRQAACRSYAEYGAPRRSTRVAAPSRSGPEGRG